MSQSGKDNREKSNTGANTIAALAANVLDKVAYAILLFYFTRYMGAGIYGRYLLVISVLFLFRTLVTFGMNGLLVRDLARDYSLTNRYLDNSLVLAICLSIFFYILFILTAVVLKYPPEVFSLFVISGFSLLPYSIVLITESVLQARQRIKTTSLMAALNSLFYCVGTIVILQLSRDLKGVFVTLFFVNVFYAFGLILALYRMGIKITLKADLRFMIEILRKVLPFGLLWAMMLVYATSGIVILSKLGTDEAIGWYGAPLKLVEVLMIIPGSLALALFPVISKYTKSSLDRLRITYEKALRYLLLTGLPLCASTALLSMPIVNLLFGREFQPSAPIMAVLALATLIMFVKSVGLIVVINSSYFNRFIYVFFIFLLTSIGIDFLMIYKLGPFGAAISRTITEFVMLAIQIIFCRMIFKQMPAFFRLAYKPFLATLIISILLYTFRTISLGALVPLAIILYMILLYVLKEINKEEIMGILNIFGLGRKKNGL
ncbi:MAG: flippase [Pseudomonadota bacterium]